MSEATHQLAAIMFTDIAGYTALMGKDEQGAIQLLEKNLSIQKPLIEQHQGKLLKEIGDGLLSSFNSVIEAVKCAIEIQDKLKDDPELNIRVGIHVGDVLFKGGDVFGDGVNIASRIESLASEGEILVSEAVYSNIKNQEGIQTEFVNEETLRNVDEPVKIYKVSAENLGQERISDSAASTQQPESTLTIEGLWKRRIPQIVGIYLVMVFVIVQIVSAIVSSYFLSPHWVKISWIFLITFLPSLIIIAYFHGSRKEPNKWLRTEKITVSLNLVFSIILILFLFRGESLGATAQSIVVKDEEGQDIKRMLPTKEFRENVLVFFFENISGDETYDWISGGLPVAIAFDLSQDIYIQALTAHGLLDEIEKARTRKIGPLPFGLMRELAQKIRTKHFLSGSFNYENGQYKIKADLYDTELGRLISQQDLSGDNLFAVIDQLNLQLKSDMGFTSSHIENTIDLQLKDILTDSEEAFKEFILGCDAFLVNLNFETAFQHLNTALESDPEFALCYLQTGVFHFINNQFSQASLNIQKAMDYLYVLPERDQFLAKYLHYFLTQQVDKSMKVLEMWKELYPQDIDAYVMLGRLYYSSGMLDEAVALYKEAIKVDDNRGNFYVQLAEILMAQKKHPEALEYSQLYADKYPGNARSFRLLGDYYFKLGEFDEADNYYEKALLLDENNTYTQGQVALIKERTGEFEDAKNMYLKSLASSRTIEDSLVIIDLLKNYHLLRGEFAHGIELWEKWLQLGKKNNFPLVLSIMKVRNIKYYLDVGRNDDALRILKEEKETFADAFQNFDAFGYINYYLHINDLEKATEELQRLLRFSNTYGSSGNVELFYQGRLELMKGNYEKSIELMEEFKEGNFFLPLEIIDIEIAKSLRASNKNDEAIALLNKLHEANPFEPESHLLLANIYLDQGDRENARKHLEISAKVWENADRNYAKAQLALKLLNNLNRAL